jgi:hypothetical protein
MFHENEERTSASFPNKTPHRLENTGNPPNLARHIAGCGAEGRQKERGKENRLFM